MYSWGASVITKKLYMDFRKEFGYLVKACGNGPLLIFVHTILIIVVVTLQY